MPRPWAMELHEIPPDQWDQINRSLVSLAVFAGLGLCGALIFLALRALVPPAATAGGVDSIRWIRWTLRTALVFALVGAVVGLSAGVSLAIDVLASIYPRFLV